MAGSVVVADRCVTGSQVGDPGGFSYMKMLVDMYQPEGVMLAIGGHYTMDPMHAAYAIRMMNAKVVVPMHYGTFPMLTGTPEQLRELTADVPGLRVIDLKPGQTLTGELAIR